MTISIPYHYNGWLGGVSLQALLDQQQALLGQHALTPSTALAQQAALAQLADLVQVQCQLNLWPIRQDHEAFYRSCSQGWLNAMLDVELGTYP